VGLSWEWGIPEEVTFELAQCPFGRFLSCKMSKRQGVHAENELMMAENTILCRRV
jgi:hypothetical protein